MLWRIRVQGVFTQTPEKSFHISTVKFATVTDVEADQVQIGKFRKLIKRCIRVLQIEAADCPQLDQLIDGCFRERHMRQIERIETPARFQLFKIVASDLRAAQIQFLNKSATRNMCQSRVGDASVAEIKHCESVIAPEVGQRYVCWFSGNWNLSRLALAS